VAQDPMSMVEKAARFASLFNAWSDEELIDFQMLPTQRGRS